jgi:diamine N-acetyltransferase
MQQNIEIVKINFTDASALSTIAKKTFYDTFTGTCTPVDMEYFLEYYYSEKVILTEIETEGYHYYFAKTDNEIIGYLLFEENNEEFKTLNKKAIELRRFYVLSEYQGKGAAQKMMDYFLNYAKQNNYAIALLGVWEYNYKAQNFYAKYGFAKTNHTHSFPVGATPQQDLYMIKKLD